MTAHQLRLKPGVTVDQALDALRRLILEAGNIHGRGITPGGLQEAYVRWLDDVERQLIALSRDPDSTQSFHTSRYWHIRDLHANPPWAGDLVSRELDVQLGRLQLSLRTLEARARRLRDAPGEMAVLDTNVLLHYEMPAQVPWDRLLGAEHARLIVPLRVVEELDQKKYSSSKRVSDSARRLLPALECWLGPGGSPGTVRPGVTIEVPVEDEERWRPADADAEILATCQDLQQYSGQGLVLVTADTSMRIRAEALELKVMRPPEQYLRKTDES